MTMMSDRFSGHHSAVAKSKPSRGGRSLLGSSFTSLFHSLRVQSIPELIERGDNAAVDGDNEDALRHYHNALEKERHSASGANSIQAALILHKIGLALARMGDSFAAMNSFEEALQIRQEKLGPGSQDAAQTTAEMLKILDDIRVQSGVGERRLVKGENGQVTSVDMGFNLLEWGEYKQAEACLKECLTKMNDDSKNDERIKVHQAMAELERAQGKYEEAKVSCVLGSWPDALAFTLYTLNPPCIAKLLMQKEHYLEVLKTAKKMNADSGKEVDMSIINSIAGYAEILRKAGDLWQSEALHRKVRNMLIASQCKKEEGGTDQEIDLHLAVSHTQLGCTVFALKKYDIALYEHQSALNIRLKALEVTDALVSESFNYCAETLCALGRETEALPLSLQAVEIRAREFGCSHPAYAHALCILSKCYHGVGRPRDAMPLIEKCLGICESVFSENHANIIPNLIVQGDILHAVGELEKALAIYQKAESIHNTNFRPGQQEFQLEECKRKIEGVMEALKNEMALEPPQSRNNTEQKCYGNNPVIIITDIGRDIDDALALIVLSSLKKMFMLNPLAVITTLAPDIERACLARTILDSLGMHEVPVGFGTDVACPGEIALHCFDGIMNQNPYQSFERGSTLMSRILRDAEPKSVKLLCIANLKDISELIVKNDLLFRTKIKEVVIMGGAKYSEARQQLIPDDTAFNNTCDLEAARHVYAECQQNHIPTTTISRYAAYGCPLSVAFLDGLQNTNHLLSGAILDANYKAMQALWKKVNMPSWMPLRGKLPARCNREWFLDFFHVQVDDSNYTSQEICKNASFYLYDSLAMLSCVEVYVDLHFTPICYKIDGTTHRVLGLLDEGVQYSGVRNKDSLVNDIEGLLRQALKLSLEGMAIIAPETTGGANGDNVKDEKNVEYDEKKTESHDDTHDDTASELTDSLKS